MCIIIVCASSSIYVGLWRENPGSGVGSSWGTFIQIDGLKRHYLNWPKVIIKSIFKNFQNSDFQRKNKYY